MGLFDNFPYTNFHELNLDWIAKKITELAKEWSEKNATWDEWIQNNEKQLADLRAYVVNYFATLDVQDEINNKLDEMLASGELESAIIEALRAPRRIATKRIKRFLDRGEIDGAALHMFVQDAVQHDGMIYTCGAYNNNAAQVVNVINEQGQFVDWHEYSELGHAGSIAVYDGLIYVAHVNEAKISTVNMETLDYIETFDYSDSFTSIWGISESGGTLYVIGRSKDDPNNYFDFAAVRDNAPEIIHRIPAPDNKVLQNMLVNNGLIYLVFNENNMVYQYQLTTGRLNTAYYLPDGDGYFPAGEYESLMLHDGRLCLLSLPYTRYINQSDWVVSIAQMFETDLDGILEKDSVYGYMPSDTRKRLTVNGNGTFTVNPSDNFTTIEEAAMILNYLGGGYITASNITGGICSFINGRFSVFCNAACTVNRLILENAYLMCDHINPAVMTANQSHAVMRLATLQNVTMRLSDIELIYTTFADAASVSCERSSITIDSVVSIPSNFTASHPTKQTNILKVRSVAVPNLLQIAKTAEKGGRLVAYLGSEPIDVGLTITGITQQTFNYAVANHSVYDQLIYEDGVFKARNKTTQSIITLAAELRVEIVIY